jgi:hypothetical protein
MERFLDTECGDLSPLWDFWNASKSKKSQSGDKSPYSEYPKTARVNFGGANCAEVTAIRRLRTI